MRSRREFLGSTAVIVGVAVAESSGLSFAPAGAEAFRPEDFGARGDGVTNDTAAFAAMAAAVNARAGGIVELRPTTYLVGAQPPKHRGPYAYQPLRVMEFIGCTRPLVIRGNGARLRCAGGLRYGTFDPRTGRPTVHRTPFYGTHEIATPYMWMIKVENCSGGVEIADLELDGNLGRHVLGGEYDGPGRQIAATGIGLYNNRGAETLRRLFIHHHALDGITIDGDHRAPAAPRLIEDVRCEANGRQGCSIVGGRGYVFRRCRFVDTGKAGIFSPPGGGVDIEAEGGKQVLDLAFENCVFSNNSGPGLIAAEGPSEGANFSGCTFVGTTMWACWPNKPGLRFSNSTFVGASVNAYGNKKQPERASQFINCQFLDDPSLSPTGEVYGSTREPLPIFDLSDNPNVRFRNCRFRLTARAKLPWTTPAVIFEDCTMTQRSRDIAYPRGTFVGRNTITGSINLQYGVNRGELIANGTRFPQGTIN